MSRRPLVCANWKMHQTASEAASWAEAFLRAIEARRAELDPVCELAVAPAHPALDRLARALEGSGVGLAAQNVHAEERGAFTGADQLRLAADDCRIASAIKVGCNEILKR